MVVFVDLDDQEVNDNDLTPLDMRDLIDSHTNNLVSLEDEEDKDDSRENPNMNSFSAALGCYP